MKSKKLVINVGLIISVLVVVYFYLFPQYQNHKIVSEIEGVFVSIDACKADVNQFVQKAGSAKLSDKVMSCDGGAASGAKISRHLKSIAISPIGAIAVRLDFRSLQALTAYTDTLTLVPLTEAGVPLSDADGGKSIKSWRCGEAKDGTTIPEKYLPAQCKR